MLTQEDLAQVRSTLEICEIHGQKLFGPEGNASAREVIREFFEKRVASENLDFMTALDAVVTNGSNADLRSELEKIYELYIAKNGESRVNLEGGTFKSLDEHFLPGHEKFIFEPKVTKANKDEFAAVLSFAVKTIFQLIGKNITKEYLNQQIDKNEQLGKENKELRIMVSAAKQEMKKYPFVDIEQHARRVSLPSLEEYVQDQAEQGKRRAIINTYEAWEKYLNTKLIIKVYLDSKNLRSFDLAYKEYADSLNQAKNPSTSSFAATMSGSKSIKAACDWENLVSLKKLIKEIDKWLNLQSTSVPHVDLKKSDTFKNILGLKEQILKDYASRMKNFIAAFDPTFSLNPEKKTLPALQTSFFHSPEIPGEAESPVSKKQLAVSNTAETSPDTDSASDKEKRQRWAGPGHQRRLSK